MKNTVLLLCGIALLTLSSCKNNDTTPIASKNNEATQLQPTTTPTPQPVTAMGAVPIDVASSIVNWRGSMLFSFGEHYGTVNLKSGQLTLDNGTLTGGDFTVDMTTIANVDGGYNEGLVEHLKNEDFFNVMWFPEAHLKITAIEHVDAIRKKIDANLTIKGVTKPIEIFKATYHKDTGILDAKVKIDRTDWGINYAAKGFAKMKDKSISDVIELHAVIHTQATP